MKKLRVTTRQTIHQEWEYEVEVPDNFELKTAPSDEQSRYILDEIYHKGIEGHYWDNDQIVDEMVMYYEKMGA